MGIGQDHSRLKEPRWCLSLLRPAVCAAVTGRDARELCAWFAPHLDGVQVERVSCGDVGMVIEARSSAAGGTKPGAMRSTWTGASSRPAPARPQDCRPRPLLLTFGCRAWAGHRAGPGLYARARRRPTAPVNTRAGAPVCGTGHPWIAHAMGEVEAAVSAGRARRTWRTRYRPQRPCPSGPIGLLFGRTALAASFQHTKETSAMGYLVRTLTPRVRAGTPKRATQDVRAR